MHSTLSIGVTVRSWHRLSVVIISEHVYVSVNVNFLPPPVVVLDPIEFAQPPTEDSRLALDNQRVCQHNMLHIRAVSAH